MTDTVLAVVRSDRGTISVVGRVGCGYSADSVSDSEYERAIEVARRAAALGYDPWRVVTALGITLRSQDLWLAGSSPEGVMPDQPLAEAAPAPE